MKAQEFISIHQLSLTYQVEVSFFNELKEVGLIEFTIIEDVEHLHQDLLSDIEKMIRMHHELAINIEGIEVVCNLLKKVTDLQHELISTKNRLRLYEDL